MLLPLLFGDPTREAVLRLLAAQDAGLTQRAIALRIGRSPSHVHKVIQAFQALGVVTVAPDRRVHLDAESPLHAPIIETLERFAAMEGHAQHLRVLVRAANQRFGDRYFFGGYLAAIRTLQPIDFHSDRADLYVKGAAPRDQEWLRPLRQLVPHDVRLHATDRIGGLVEEGATLDDEPCPVATPEIGVMQCLADDSFPRYGAFLLLVQALDEWDGARDRLERAAVRAPSYDALPAVLDHLDGGTAASTIPRSDLHALHQATATVRGS